MEGIHTANEPADRSRVLVLGPAGGDDGVCPGLAAGSTARNVLKIVYEQPLGTAIDDWRDPSRDSDGSLAVIAPPRPETVPADVRVTQVPVTDLTGIDIAVGRYLDRWDGQAVVCLDSLSALLDHVEEGRLFRFLHTLTGRFVAAGAAAHVHLDPEGCDDRTVATLATLFDTVVRHEGGEWVVDG